MCTGVCTGGGNGLWLVAGGRHVCMGVTKGSGWLSVVVTMPGGCR